MFSKVHLRASTHAFVYSESSFPFLWANILIPSKYLSVKYTYILSLTALSFSSLKYLLRSLYFGFVCGFFFLPELVEYIETCCHLKPFSSLFSTFSPHMHLLASDTLKGFPRVEYPPKTRREAGACCCWHTIHAALSKQWQFGQHSFLISLISLMALPGGMGCAPISFQSSTSSGPGISGLGPVLNLQEWRWHNLLGLLAQLSCYHHQETDSFTCWNVCSAVGDNPLSSSLGCAHVCMS